MATAQIDSTESPITDIPELSKTDALIPEEQKEESSGAGKGALLEEKEAEPVVKPSEADQEGNVDGVIEVAAVKEAVESQAGEEPTVVVQQEEAGEKETEPTAKDEGESSVIVDGLDGNEPADDAQSSSGIVRTATPGSRTSTPPPGTALAAPKKFSAVNVTKKFLSKTSQPAVAPAAGSKLGANGRASASPVPISTPSRLLSTKLTTAPLAKSSASPNPPPPGVTPASSASPWAKPTLLPEASSSDSSSLAQPAPRRSLANLAASIGQGQGISATKPVAWRAVAPEGTSRFGMSRDFPTAREIADGESRLGREIAAGKMQAQAAAQAQAAHNQALLKSLNMFTNVDSAHRWDDDDDEDDMIDFGDKLNLPPAAPPVEAPPKPAQYVAADDFDRSWPRKAPVEISTRRTDEPRDRVLFNASSNRLEPSLPRQNAPPAPTRLMSRGAEPSRPPPPSDRQLPPHQQPPTQPGSRALPPHMAGGMPERLPPPPKPPAAPVTTMTGRSSWGLPRDVGRSAADAPRGDSLSPVKPASALPSRPTWEQQANAQAAAQPIPPSGVPPPVQAAPGPASAVPVPAAAQPPTGPKVDDQTAEMHTAAERARLRREAEEAERSAAMERARKKAKELEERLGLKPAAPAAPAASAPTQAAAPPQPPVPTQPAILRRPIPSPAAAPAPPPGLPASSAAPPPVISPVAPASRPEPSRQVESSWRARPTATELPKPAELAVAQKPAASQPRVEPILQAHAAAEPSLREAIHAAPLREAPPHVTAPPPQVSLPPNPTILQRAPVVETVVRLPGQPPLPESEAAAGKKESGFDSMLARIQAAMAEARLAPPSIAEVAILTQSALPALSPQPPQSQPKPSTPSQPAEIFDVTQVPPPRTPPPAWRTYVVRVPPPSTSAPKSPIPAPRLKAADTPLSHPQGWLLVFQPPLDLPQNSILADLLLPRPIFQQRFGRPVDTTPIVSISPRTLEPFERKKKKVPAQAAKALPAEVEQPPTSAENLTAPSAGYGWQQAQASAPAAEAGPSVTAAPAATGVTSPPAAATSTEVAAPEPPANLLGQNIAVLQKSPVRASPAAKAEKEGQFAQEAVTVGPIARSRPVEVKSGVRFMVSSELEGDSLLDEVNKMSLETVGEGWGGVDKEEVSLPKTPGSETPKTPPSLNSGQPTSPNGAGTPWNRSTPRGATQHDHLKSVWDQAGSTDTSRTAPAPTDLPLPPPLIPIPSTQSAQSDASTPMYPSLNAPSSSEIIPSQPLPAAKLGYPSPSAFSPGAPSAHLGFMRPPVSPHGYMYHAPRPTDSAENYGSIAGRPNGGFSAPWSPAAFGASMTSPGYGYAGKQAPPHAPSPVDGKDAHYGFSQAAFSQQPGYGQAYGQQHHLGANAYARGVGAGSYAYAYAQQGAAPGAGTRAGGRFGPHAQVQQPVNGDYAQGGGVYGVEGVGYYGGIGAQQQRQGQHVGQIHSPVYGAHPHAQQQHPQHPQGQGQGYGGGGAGAVGQQIMRGGRKMW